MFRKPEAVAKEVFSNFEQITGVSLNNLSFQQAMDGDFIEETVYLIDEWVKSKYPGVDIFNKDSQVLNALDRLLEENL